MTRELPLVGYGFIGESTLKIIDKQLWFVFKKTFTTVEVDDNLPKSTKIDRSIIKSFSNIDGVIIDR